MKYKVGDEVSIRTDLKFGAIYRNEDNSGGDVFNRVMGDYAGQKAKIVGFDGQSYILDIDRYHYYTDGMLETWVDPLSKVDPNDLKPYTFNEDVERIIMELEKNNPQRLIDHALDTGNKEEFQRLVNLYITK
jgi:hypothetical protein